MTRETINPDSMYNSLHYGFSHATRSQGQTKIYCAGQVAWDENGNLVGAGDLAKQAQQVFINLKTVLREAGATPADVVRMRTYVVNHKPQYLEVIANAAADFYAQELPAANTLIGVQSLALPEFLIEVEVTAIID